MRARVSVLTTRFVFGDVSCFFFEGASENTCCVVLRQEVHPPPQSSFPHTAVGLLPALSASKFLLSSLYLLPFPLL